MAYPSTCLGNLIALQGGCDPVVPTSGLYGASIGISNDFISQIITKEYASNLIFWNEKKNFGIENICNALHSVFAPQYKTASLIKNFRVGHANDNKVLVAGSGVKGIYYDFADTSSYYDLFVSELSLFVNVTQDVPVNVYDLLQNKIIDTITVPTTAGEISKVFPAKKYSSQQKKLSLFFGYDSTGINSYKTSLSAGGCSNCNGRGDYINNTYHRLQAATIPVASAKVHENITGLSETGGMSINHSLQCNHLDWLCGMSGLIALPILYRTAAFIVEFALDESPNTRTNSNVTLNRDILKERLDRYELKWRECLDNIIKNAHVPNDSKCFECNRTFINQAFAI